MKRLAVFLDRDGVINRAMMRDGLPRPPQSLGELEILPGVCEALRALESRGYARVVVTNQPDVARGSASRKFVDDLHAKLRRELSLDAIMACFHDDADNCDCRKPKPGLLLQAAIELGIDLPGSFMVGDRWRDIEAGRRAGCRTFYIDRGYAERAPIDYDFKVDCLAEAAAVVLAEGHSS